MNSSLRLARRPGIAWVLGAAVLLAGCSVLDKPTRATVFDFGASAVPVAQGQANAARVPVALADVEAPSVSAAWRGDRRGAT